MESIYLKTLVEVVRTGSLSRAADTLCVTQPAVSRRIKFLEEHYGCPLLDRSGARLRPTEAGRLVYQKAETLLGIEDDLIAGLHLLDGKARISFSSTPSFGIAHLPAILKEFMLTCGDEADLKFTFHAPRQILDGLDEGLFDVAVMELCNHFDLSAHLTVPLPGDEMVFVSAPRLGVPSPATSLDALLAFPFFVRREGCCSRIFLENNLHAGGRDLREFRRTIVVDDLHLVVKAVLDGEGVAFLSRDVLRDHLTAGRLSAHYVSGFECTRERSLVFGRSLPVSGPLAQFVRTLFTHFDLPVPDTVVTTAPPELAPA